MYGPDATWARLGAASSPEGKEIDDFSDIFDIHKWVDKKPVQIGELTVVPRLVCHPTESYGMRFTDPSGATFVYSGDTGYCDALIDLARGRRRVPVRGVVDAIRRIGRRSCICRAPRPAARRRKPVCANCS